jgi:ribosomal protein S18 acetylase RimI-like enzyme
MGIEIRDANREDAEFIAWVMLTAFRSHLERGLWDLVVGGDEKEVLRFLGHLASTERPHWSHYSIFRIAEVEGERAAALAGYFDRELGRHALAESMPEVNRAVGRSEADIAAGVERAGSIALVGTEHGPDAWVIENVATRPEFRRLGLVDRLIREMLERGRSRDATTAEIGVLIGNTPAQLAYEKNGFKVVSEKRHPAFEAAYRCPGIRFLTQDL